MARAWGEEQDDAAFPPFDPARVRDILPMAKPGRHRDWRKRMSDTVAYALLVYTALQIFVTMNALKAAGASLLPYLALIILVAAIIPSCRQFERRWNRLNDAQATDPAFARRFHRDRLLVWVLAIGLPFAITGAFRLLGVVFPGIAR